MEIKEIWNRIREGKLRIPKGIYSYRGIEQFLGLSLQLRVEEEGNGLLLINANTVLYLNETATAHAYLFMQGLSTEEAVQRIREIYNINREEQSE
jgi:hypothetical protein